MKYFACNDTKCYDTSDDTLSQVLTPSCDNPNVLEALALAGGRTLPKGKQTQNMPQRCKHRAKYADLEILGQLLMRGCSTVK